MHIPQKTPGLDQFTAGTLGDLVYDTLSYFYSYYPQQICLKATVMYPNQH